MTDKPSSPLVRNPSIRAPIWFKPGHAPTDSGIDEGQVGEARVPGDTLREAPPERIESPCTMEVLVGNSKVDRLGHLFAGTCGTRDTDGVWRMDPLYARVCYLYDLMADAEAQRAMAAANPALNSLRELGDHGIYVPVTMEKPGGLAAVRMTLLKQMAPGWMESYEQLLGGSGAGLDVALSALAVEKARVQVGVKRVLDSAGLSEWDVPVVFEAYAASHEARDAEGNEVSETALLAACTKLVSSVRLHPDRAPVPKADLAPLSAPVPDAMANHDGGIKLNLEGTMRVFAADQSEAAQVAVSLIELTRAPGMCRLIDLRPLAVVDYELEPPERETWGEDAF